MQTKLSHKLAIICGLCLLLLIPLLLIGSQISARGDRQKDVLRDIAESSAGSQTLIGPIVAIRFKETVDKRITSKDGSETVQREIVDRVETLPPETLDIRGEGKVTTRNRGLYKARVYHLSLDLVGQAIIPAGLRLGSGGAISNAQAFLVLGISDTRGIGNDPQVTLNGKRHRLIPGTVGGLPGQGGFIPLGAVESSKEARFDFSLPLTLSGLEKLAIAPAGNTTTVSLKSDWPHPSFQGRFLPVNRTVNATGFEASWQVSHLSRDFGRVMKATEEKWPKEVMEINFMDPVNVYLQAERAVKYGILFVFLTFAGFFLTEVLSRLSAHPLQYLLVGLALAIFFLLLIALSEHIRFGIAYLISSIACVSLISFYISGVLKNQRLGTAFGVGISLLYAILYGVLLSEDNALLMGSALLFAALGGVMICTRHIDWYRVAETSETIEPDIQL